MRQDAEGPDARDGGRPPLQCFSGTWKVVTTYARLQAKRSVLHEQDHQHILIRAVGIAYRSKPLGVSLHTTGMPVPMR